MFSLFQTTNCLPTAGFHSLKVAWFRTIIIWRVTTCLTLRLLQKYLYTFTSIHCQRQRLVHNSTKSFQLHARLFIFLFNFNIFIKRRGVNILSRTRLGGCYIILRVYSPKPKKTPCPPNEKDQVRKTDLSSSQPQVGGAQPHQLAQGSRLDCLLGQVNAPPQRLIAPAQGNDNNCNLLFPSCYTICLIFFFFLQQ